MAKLSTLIDDFQDNVIDASKWLTTGTVAETGGRAKLTPTTSYSFWGAPARVYDLTDSQGVAHIPVVTSNGSTGTLQCGMVVDKDTNNLIGMRKVGSQLICTKSVAGVETQLSFTPYSAVNHLFWRIRADATNVYWETSSTGSGYFIQNTASIASLGFAITAVGFYFYTGYAGVEAFPGTFQIEAVNPGLPLSSAGTSTSSGSLALLATSPLSITGAATSTSSGGLALSLVAAASLYFTSSALSTSTGTLHLDILATGGITGSALSTSSGRLYLTTIAAPSLPGGTWYFEPPIAYDLPPTLPEPTTPRYINAHAKWKGGQRRGRSVLKTNGVYTVVDTPTVDQLAAADIAYQGGHIYPITVEEAYALYVAGFDVYPGADILTTEAGDLITTESGDILTAEYSFGTR